MAARSAGDKVSALARKREAQREAHERAKEAIADKASTTFQRMTSNGTAAKAKITAGGLIVGDSSAPAAAASSGGDKGSGKTKQGGKKRRKAAVMSFSMDDDDDEDSGLALRKAGCEGEPKRPRLGKDPSTDTSFLPDADRAAAEASITAQLKGEWRAAQEKLKEEELTVDFSYYDGSGHRRQATVKKGTTIAKFLEVVRQDLAKSFPEMKRITSDTLLYVKEDLIIPHNMSFYELIVTRARGKSGPLFEFAAVDDLRLRADARVETTESHPGKIVERRWFDANKHVFPMTRWEVYDPSAVYDRYTTHGGEVRASK